MYRMRSDIESEGVQVDIETSSDLLTPTYELMNDIYYYRLVLSGMYRMRSDIES